MTPSGPNAWQERGERLPTRLAPRRPRCGDEVQLGTVLDLTLEQLRRVALVCPPIGSAPISIPPAECVAED